MLRLWLRAGLQPPSQLALVERGRVPSLGLDAAGPVIKEQGVQQASKMSLTKHARFAIWLWEGALEEAVVGAFQAPNSVSAVTGYVMCLLPSMSCHCG